MDVPAEEVAQGEGGAGRRREQDTEPEHEEEPTSKQARAEADAPASARKSPGSALITRNGGRSCEKECTHDRLPLPDQPMFTNNSLRLEPLHFVRISNSRA